MGVLLYHYTSMECFQQIRNSGVVRPTRGMSGLGVYLTEMPPEAGRLLVALNNYGALKNLTTSKLACTEMCFVFDSRDIGAVRLPTTDGRNIWVSRRTVSTHHCRGCFFSVYNHAHTSLVRRGGQWYAALGSGIYNCAGLPIMYRHVPRVYY